jgi:hypothetical protein
MIAGREDPFAIQLLIQSADGLLGDVAKNKGKTLAFTWDEFVKPEYRSAVRAAMRETSNFLKHADTDPDAELYVAEIAKLNILQLGTCIVNYHSVFGEWTQHMQLLMNVARIVFPKSFVPEQMRALFDASLPKIERMTLAEYFAGWWDDPLLRTALPKLAPERAEDLQDLRTFYATQILALRE